MPLRSFGKDFSRFKSLVQTIEGFWVNYGIFHFSDNLDLTHSHQLGLTIAAILAARAFGNHSLERQGVSFRKK